MTPLQALIDARALLAEPERWTQGAYAKTKRGRVIGPDARAAACWCSVGALRRAAGADYPQAVREITEVACSAIDNIYDWNDAPERTHAEVLAAFDAAIARLEARP